MLRIYCPSYVCSLVFESSPGKKRSENETNPPSQKKEKKKSNNTTSHIANIILLYTISIHGWRNLTELPVVWGLAHSCYTIYCKTSKFWLHNGILLATVQWVEIRWCLRKGSTNQIFTSWPRYCTYSALSFCTDSHKTKRRIMMMHKIIRSSTCQLQDDQPEEECKEAYCDWATCAWIYLLMNEWNLSIKDTCPFGHLAVKRQIQDTYETQEPNVGQLEETSVVTA